jgi:hypothetical protein
MLLLLLPVSTVSKGLGVLPPLLPHQKHPEKPTVPYRGTEGANSTLVVHPTHNGLTEVVKMTSSYKRRLP